MKIIDKSYLVERSVLILFFLDCLAFFVVLLTVKYSTLYDFFTNTKVSGLIVFSILMFVIQLFVYYNIYRCIEKQENIRFLERKFKTNSLKTVKPISAVDDLTEVTRFYAIFNIEMKEVTVFVQYKNEDFQRLYEVLKPEGFLKKYIID